MADRVAHGEVPAVLLLQQGCFGALLEVTLINPQLHWLTQRSVNTIFTERYPRPNQSRSCNVHGFVFPSLCAILWTIMKFFPHYSTYDNILCTGHPKKTFSNRNSGTKGHFFKTLCIYLPDPGKGRDN